MWVSIRDTAANDLLAAHGEIVRLIEEETGATRAFLRNYRLWRTRPIDTDHAIKSVAMGTVIRVQFPLTDLQLTLLRRLGGRHGVTVGWYILYLFLRTRGMYTPSPAEDGSQSIVA